MSLWLPAWMNPACFWERLRDQVLGKKGSATYCLCLIPVARSTYEAIAAYFLSTFAGALDPDQILVTSAAPISDAGLRGRADQ